MRWSVGMTGDVGQEMKRMKDREPTRTGKLRSRQMGMTTTSSIGTESRHQITLFRTQT